MLIFMFSNNYLYVFLRDLFLAKSIIETQKLFLSQCLKKRKSKPEMIYLKQMVTKHYAYNNATTKVAYETFLHQLYIFSF